VELVCHGVPFDPLIAGHVTRLALPAWVARHRRRRPARWEPRHLSSKTARPAFTMHPGVASFALPTRRIRFQFAERDGRVAATVG